MKFNSLDEIPNKTIENLLDQVESFDVKTVSFGNIKEVLTTLMHGFTTRTISLPATPLYRARKNEDTPNFNNIFQLQHPPKEKVKYYGRLNKPKQSIFYGASKEITSVVELQPNLGDEITIYRSVLPKETSLNVMGLGIDQSHFKNLGSIHDNHQVNKYIRSAETVKKNKLIHEFLIKSFTQKIKKGEENNYKITAAISDIFLSSNDIHGFLYPSIAMDKTAVNLGLKPSAYLKYYKPLDCWKIKILKELGKNKFEVQCTSKAKSIAPNGNIKW